MATSVTARVDYENNGEVFWGNLREQLAWVNPESELKSILKTLLANDEVEICDPVEIQRFDDFVTSIDGWEGGPSHAPHPIVFTAN